ncbi:MAG: alkaline phosphatase [Verrucomicrobiota bacterium]
MKWRNQFLALFCLLGFAGLGVVYFRLWVVQKPFGIVLFIGEGLAPGRLAATRVYVGGADARLALDSMDHAALIRNYSNDFAAPDQAAAATALATGAKVNNHAIGVDVNGSAIMNIIELARASGRATGLVTDTSLTNPTCAAFYAHTAHANDTENLALQLVERRKFDVALGGGATDFLPQTKNGRRRDGRDLIFEMRRDGFEFVQSRAELEAIPVWRRPKLLGLFGSGSLSYLDQVAAHSDQPRLSDMVRRAIELLQFNRGGYLLVVDAGLMREAAQSNKGERTLAETAELDRAVRVARRYVGRKAMILVCGDTAIGGLSLNGFPFRKDSGVALLGLNSAGDPTLSWATGPNGVASYGASKLSTGAKDENSNLPADTAAPQPPQEPAAIYAPAAANTVDDMVAFGNGPGTDLLHGSADNTIIFQIIRDNL